MTSDPTPDAPPTAPAPVADYVAANRIPVAVALIAVGVVCLAVGGYYLAKGFNAAKVEKKAEKPDEAAPEVEIADPNRPAYFAAGILGVFGAVVGVGVGGSLLARPPRPDPAGRRAEARTTILLAGGLFGFVLMLAGLWFFYLWFGSLTTWLDQGKRGEAKWVLGPILVFVLGAALAFAAAQPARAEERNNPLLRRLVYGTNLGLTALLLLLVLTVGNVFAAVRVPNQLDVTESGFYTLDDSTRQVIAELDQPVTAYSTLSESLAQNDTDARMIRDARNLLTAAQDVNPSKFRVRSLSPQLDQAEVSRLAAKFPQFDKQDMGILLVAGEDESRASFIRASELFTTDFEGRTPTVVFQGEARLVRELLFLSEGKTRPVVYFTQGHGELEIAPRARGAAVQPAGVRTANQIRTALENNNVDVRPLVFDPANPKVPDDATVVAVADPATPMPKEQAEAIRKFMTEPRPGDTKKKGKLIVLTSPHPKPENNAGVVGTGLEDMLAGFGVRLGTEYIYNEPLQNVSYDLALTAMNVAAVRARNPVALAFSRRRLIMPNCREVNPPGGPGGPFQVVPLFVSMPDRITWLEPDPLTNPAQRWEQLLKNPGLRNGRGFTDEPRSLSVLVSEPPEPGAKGANPIARVAVYGSGEFFADPEAGGRPSQTPAELFAATLDWLRDRPVVNIANKNYHQYTLKAEPDAARILYLPVGVTVLGVLAVGFGMWVFRQK
jgi:hypothetical protein